MSTRCRFTGKRLPLTLAFGALVAAAMGAACNGFFLDPTLTSLTINPTAPSVEVGTSTTLQAYGVNSDGQGSYLTSGVSWSSSDITVVTVTGNGSAKLTGVGGGTATITASDQSVTSTATATAYVVISAISIAPTSQSMAATASTTFTVYANNSNIPANDLSETATLTVYLTGTTTIATGIGCAQGTPSQTCTSTAATPGTYDVIATYPGTNLTAKATLIIN